MLELNPRKPRHLQLVSKSSSAWQKLPKRTGISCLDWGGLIFFKGALLQVV